MLFITYFESIFHMIFSHDILRKNITSRDIMNTINNFEQIHDKDSDIIETKSKYEKYIIFLPEKFFYKSSIFKTIYQNIRKKLRYKGIMTYDIDKYGKKLAYINKICDSYKLLGTQDEYEYHANIYLNNLLKKK